MTDGITKYESVLVSQWLAHDKTAAVLLIPTRPERLTTGRCNPRRRPAATACRW